MLCPICHEERDTVGMTPAYCVTVCVIASCPQFGKPLVSRNEEFDALVEGVQMSQENNCHVADVLTATFILLIVLAGIVAYLIAK